MISQYAVFLFLCLTCSSFASILDNRTTNDTDSELIRALRHFPAIRDVMEYNLGPYHEDYYGRPIGGATARPANLPPLRKAEKCATEPCESGFDAYAAWPFIIASIFIILAVFAYVVLFCFVFRFLV